MFEIGSSLREARVRRGLELAQVERDTRIRPRYLMALEEEQFEVLPGPAYAKGFLRTYADYLGLDAQRFIDEYNSRFAPPPSDEPAGAVPVRIQRPRRFARWWIIVPVAIVLALIGWQVMRSPAHRAALPPPPTTTTHIVKQLGVTPARPTVARLVLVAARGRCWIEARSGSASGPVVFIHTLEQGTTARLHGTRLWLRIGAPWNIDAKLNGKAVQLPTATGNVVVTSRGARAG